MGAERRLENKRMKVSKRMEVSCLETGTWFEGETEDISDAGIRAFLSRSPQKGANVMVKLYWDEAKQPVETFGRVAWTTPLPAGEGIEVGLMLGAEGDVYGKKEKKKTRAATRYHKYKPTNTRQYIPFKEDWRAYDDDSIENKKTLAAIPAPTHAPVPPAPEPVMLINGESFKVSFQGKETWAKIAGTNNIDSHGEIQITLQIKDKSLWKRPQKQPTKVCDNAPLHRAAKTQPPTEDRHDEDEFNPEKWKARPFRNAYQFSLKTIRPVAKMCAVLLSIFTVFSRTILYFAWKKIPLSGRAKIMTSVDEIKRHRTVSGMRSVIRFTQTTSHKIKTILARQ